MKNTLKNFKTLTELFDQTLTNEEIVALYKKSNTEDKGLLVAQLFVKNYGILQRDAEKFYFMDDEEKASTTLEVLQKAMMDYDPESGYKFNTMISKYMTGKYLEERSSMSRDKRKANYEANSYEGMMSASNKAQQAGIFTGLDNIEFEENLSKIDSLTSSELKFCRIRSKYDKTSLSDSDIASMLGISSSAVFQLKKSLKVKLAVLV